ncbi:uncharacterized protein LOC105694826 [Orussus abietinus]|uniref:uncharacterized protein LOC105694826 n=1 Tax=Orussus abietinus TaxID=222816 RepID=UPI0006253081|nr:uncharacterized protein LOC105694826 [Orussus abietinus]
MARKQFLTVAVVAVLFGAAQGIRCYQCVSMNSSSPFQCNEFMTDDTDLEPVSCDTVYDAQYCVKHVGRFEVLALDCYQCTSAMDWECGDDFLVVEALQPKNCNHIFEAQFCVKSIGRYGGGIGTKRFCSAVNLGNYCNYLNQPGDTLNYRTCVYTCSSDGCNSARSLLPGVVAFVTSGFLLIWSLFLLT